MRKLLILLTASLLASATAMAQTEKASIKKSVLPDYPKEARELNVQGVVVLEALIDESGNIFATDIVESPDNLLSQAAIEAVQGWDFNPALKDGQPVMQVVRIPILFNLNDPLRDSVLAAGSEAIASR